MPSNRERAEDIVLGNSTNFPTLFGESTRRGPRIA
jgi:hypothetical protein